MMLHRHFENAPNENMTTSAVLNPKEGEDFREEAPSPEEKPKRGRKKKTEE